MKPKQLHKTKELEATSAFRRKWRKKQLVERFPIWKGREEN